MRSEARTGADASAGEIDLASIRPDSTLEGTLTLRFGSTEVISRGFRAVWRPRHLFCG